MKSLRIKRPMLTLLVVILINSSMVQGFKDEDKERPAGTVYNAALGAYVPESQVTRGGSISIPGVAAALGGTGYKPGQAIAVPGRAISDGFGTTSIGGASVAVAGSSGINSGRASERPLAVVGTGGLAVGVVPVANNFDDRPKPAAFKNADVRSESPSAGFAYQKNDNDADFALSLDNSPTVLGPKSSVVSTTPVPLSTPAPTTLSSVGTTTIKPLSFPTPPPAPTSFSSSSSKTPSQILAALEIFKGTSLVTPSPPTTSTSATINTASISTIPKTTTSLFPVTAQNSATTTASTSSAQVTNTATVSAPVLTPATPVPTAVNPKTAALLAAGQPLIPNPPGSVNRGNTGPETIVNPPNPKIDALLAAGQPLIPNPPGSVNRGNDQPEPLITATPPNPKLAALLAANQPLIPNPPGSVNRGNTELRKTITTTSTPTIGPTSSVSSVIKVPRPLPVQPATPATRSTTVVRNEPTTGTSTTVDVKEVIPVPLAIPNPVQVEDYKNSLIMSILNQRNANDNFRNYIRDSISANSYSSVSQRSPYSVTAVGAPSIQYGRQGQSLDSIAIGGDAIVMGGGHVNGGNILIDTIQGTASVSPSTVSACCN